MNTSLTALYAAIHDNKVEVIDTNLKLFVEQVNKLHAGSRNYAWFYRAFAANDYFTTTIDGKEYFFQKVV